MSERRHTAKRLITALIVALPQATACSCNEATEFPPGLEPLAENTARPPQASDGDPYPEGYGTAFGRTSEYHWGHLRGYIHAPVAAVWLAFADPEVVANRRVADELEFVLDSEPEYDHSYTIRYWVDEGITVQWDEAWRFGALQGTLDDPYEVIGRSQKVYGTTFINRLEHQMTMRALTDDVSEFGIIEHLDAVAGGRSEIEQSFADLFDSVRARAQGLPLPTYD